MCSVSTQVNDWGKFYLPISITLPEILYQFQAFALVQFFARHSNGQRTRSLCIVLSHTHHKQLECGDNESAGVLNSTVSAALLSVCISEEPSIAPTATGSLVQTPSMERHSFFVGQTRKWSNFSQKTGNKDVISAPTTVTLTPNMLESKL